MDRVEGGGGGGVGRTAGEEEEEASMALDPELVQRLKKFAVRFSVRMGGGQGGAVGVLTCCLPSVIRLLAAHPVRDAEPFLLLLRGAVVNRTKYW